ncbi:MAG TPA: hypothetical protein VF975_01440, partial [Thermoanaerobaculia bacterium]
AAPPGSLGDRHEPILRVGGKNAEASPPGSKRAEVAFVEREDVVTSVPIREDYDGSIGQADVQVMVGLDDRSRFNEVFAAEDREFVGAVIELFQE